MSRRTECGPFDVSAILRSTVIRHVEYHPVLESTNRTAVELLAPLLEHSPSLVLTAEQTAGRGRKGNSWWSGAGALTFSLVFDPHQLPLAEEQRPLLSLVSGLAVRDAIAELTLDHPIRIKWPNDVYVGQLKISGILAEQHPADGRQGLIVGIGINANNSLQQAPAEIRQRAISIFDIRNESIDLTGLLISVLNHLDRRFRQAGSQMIGFLAEANHLHLLQGKTVIVRTGLNLISGHCLGIDDQGNLVVRERDQLHRLSSGEVVNWS